MDAQRPLTLLIELYNKQGQQTRVGGSCAEALKYFDFALELAPLSANHKACGWTYAQVGFLLGGFCYAQPAARMLSAAIAQFELQYEEEKNPDLAALVLVDKAITQLNLVSQLPACDGRIEHLLKEAEEALVNSPNPTSQRLANLCKSKGDYERSQGNFERARDLHQRAIDLGADALQWALLQTYCEWFETRPACWRQLPVAFWTNWSAALFAFSSFFIVNRPLCSAG